MYYDTYQEAKAAHPDCDAIVTTGKNWKHKDKSEVGKFQAAWLRFGEYMTHPGKRDDDESFIIDDESFVICNPSDYEQPEMIEEFVKVDCNFFEIEDDLKAGKLYNYTSFKDEYACLGDDYVEAAKSHDNGTLYRKVLRPATWQEKTLEWLNENQSVRFDFGTDFVTIYDGKISNDVFLSMCHIVAQMTTKPE